MGIENKTYSRHSGLLTWLVIPLAPPGLTCTVRPTPPLSSHLTVFVFVVSFFKATQMGEYCAPGLDIASEQECRAAAERLGLRFAQAWGGKDKHRNCLHAQDSRNEVWFNTAGISDTAQTPNPQYSSICRTGVPYPIVHAASHSAFSRCGHQSLWPPLSTTDCRHPSSLKKAIAAVSSTRS